MIYGPFDRIETNLNWDNDFLQNKYDIRITTSLRVFSPFGMILHVMNAINDKENLKEFRFHTLSFSLQPAFLCEGITKMVT